MGEGSVNLSSDNQNIKYHIVTLLEKIDLLTNENECTRVKVPLLVEVRALEFWRSVISECLASFCYIFIVCGAAAGNGPGADVSSVFLATALAAGFTMTTLTQCFGHISGAHVNPAVTVAMGITKRISFLRTMVFVIAQCGGGVAGAAFLYGVSVPGYQSNLSAALAHSADVAVWERLWIEVILTFIVVFTYYVSMDSYRKWMGNSAITIGAAYTACTFVSMPYLNPARSLGPSFVLNKWENHWVYWLGPLVGGIASGLVYEYIFNLHRRNSTKDASDEESSSIRSDEDAYDELNKPTSPKFNGSTYQSYRPAGTAEKPAYCPSLASTSLYSTHPAKLERVESLYGGTKSLYCKSPPLTRANLNRSQSVYARSNSGLNRDALPRPGPLVPAQSLYPMRFHQQQQSHFQNQNVHNQLQQCAESVYGIRGVIPGAANRTDDYESYRTRNETGNDDGQKPLRGNRPESMYAMANRRAQGVPSDDSTYGSVHGSANRNGTGAYISSNPVKSGNYSGRVGDVRQSPSQIATNSAQNNTYHSNLPQHSPSSQYFEPAL